MEQKNLKLAVKNFGPIREGEVEFKPLTVFIGPNNSGKSYMATLLYALVQALMGKRGLPYIPPRLLSPNLSNREVEELAEWSLGILAKSDEDNGKLTHSIHPILLSYFDDRTREIEFSVPIFISDYFGCMHLTDLVYMEGQKELEFSVDLFEMGVTTPFVSIRDGINNLKTGVNIEQGSLAYDDIEILRIARSVEGNSFSPEIFSYLIERLWTDNLTSKGLPASGIPTNNIFYLPAGRSGLLQGWQLIASLAVGMIGRGIGTRNFEIPSFPGVARDFTQELLGLMPPRRDRRDSDSIIHTIRLLEERILHGTIHIRTSSNLPTIGYQSNDLQIPVQRSSSMISELAPIHLWMKHVLKKGDVLIIDEPEAHLHPENQRLIAQVLVRLMNAGVHVVCATHSSLILHQMSNHILATSSGKLDDVGFTEHDQLRLEDIGVYLFEPSEDGVYVKDVEVDSDFGISEDEFVRVADSIGDETYQLVT